MDQNTFTKLTPSELVNVFPEALPIVREKLKEWKEYRKTIAPLYEELLDAAIAIIVASDSDTEKKKAIVKQWNKMIYEDEGTYLDGEPVPWGLSGKLRLAQIDHHIKRLETLEGLYKEKKIDEDIVKIARSKEDMSEKIKRIHVLLRGHRAPRDIGPNEIAQAKTVPIAHYLTVNRVGFARCIFHNEKTGSMRVYADNHFFCYGCQRKGDVIDIVCELQHLEFIDGVKHILSMT